LSGKGLRETLQMGVFQQPVRRFYHMYSKGSIAMTTIEDSPRQAAVNALAGGFIFRAVDKNGFLRHSAARP
jgi:hypothetical protein